MMRARALFLLPAACLAWLHASPGRAGIDVGPDALTHYAYCVSQAKDRLFVYVLGRHLLYRCHDDIAVSYYNFLGRSHAREVVVHEPTGVYVYRQISGVGRCWFWMADEFGNPVAAYGCDIYVEI